MARPNNYLAERNSEIEWKFRKGYPAFKLAKEYGISRARVYEIIKRQRQLQSRISA